MKEKRILFLILLLSLTLNIIGFTWGLPVNWHPDMKEKHVLFFFETGDLNPHLFINPSFYVYCLYLACKIALFFTSSLSYTDVFVISRVFTALIGTFSVFIVYLLAKNIFGVRAGLYSALFSALSAGTVSYSHFTIPEIMATALMTLTLYNLVRYIDCGKSAYLYYSGAILGLALSTKYTSGLVFIFILAGMLVATKEDSKAERDILKMPLFSHGLSIISIAVGILLCIFAFSNNNREIIASVTNFLNSAKVITYWNEHKPEYVPTFVAEIKKLSALTGAFLLILPLGLYIKVMRRILAKVFFGKEFAVVLFLMAAFFCIGTPFSILDYRQFLHDLFLN